MMKRLTLAVLLAGSAPALALPDFVPKPSDIYEGYVALEMPRTEVPVGALWVQGYGPTGEGAAADNLVTERSLSQVTINTELHIALTAGILNLFGLDPSYRNKLTARFGDLSVVRVKDMGRLSGPASEPRIHEAIKAGSVTITTDNDAGLDLETRALGQRLPVVGRSDNGRRRSFSIDGKDMFIAFRVASQEVVKGKPDSVRLKKSEDGWRATANGRDVVLSLGDGRCGSAHPAGTPAVSIIWLPEKTSIQSTERVSSPPPSPPAAPASPSTTPDPSSAFAFDPETGLAPAPVAPTTSPTAPAQSPQPLPPPQPAALQPIAPLEVASSHTSAEPAFLNGAAMLPLRVPVADGKGGLFEKAAVTQVGREAAAGELRDVLCSSSASSLPATVQLIGRRLQTFREPKAPRW